MYQVEKGQINKRSVSMYPAQWRVVESRAKQHGLSLSLAMRHIVDEWLAAQESESSNQEAKDD